MTDYRNITTGLVSLYLLSCSGVAQAAPLAPSHAYMPARTISWVGGTLDLTLSDAIYLGLRDNRSIRSVYLERIAQKFDLRVEEDRFTPKLTLSGRQVAYRNQSDRYRQAELLPQTTWQTPSGARFSMAWSNQLSVANGAGRARNDGATFSVIQPLLRGAGREVSTAPLRLARLGEQLNKLNLKATVSDAITQIILAYRELLRAQAQLQIANDALLRSRHFLEANQAMIAAGRMAAFERVQSEADVASQELAVEQAINQLDAARLGLLHLLALSLNTSVRAVDTLAPQRIDIPLAQALNAAREQQPNYLMQLIAREQADINLRLADNEQQWDVSLIGGATQVRDRYREAGERKTERSWEGYAGVQIDIPINDLSRRQAKVRAQVQVANQLIRVADSRQLLERDVENAVRDLNARWRQYEIAERARDLSRRKLDIEREKLTAGRSSNFQVISFETDLRGAESTRLDALIAYFNAQSTLDQHLGTTLASWDIELND
ncbi:MULTISPECIES: TolC family protein [unclassified Pseudomonas]|uniref:TolC family protein n=1 Tax=unclassified Pseudomonas TaxID=196821 RepID=UPI003917C30E